MKRNFRVGPAELKMEMKKYIKSTPQKNRIFNLLKYKALFKTL